MENRDIDFLLRQFCELSVSLASRRVSFIAIFLHVSFASCVMAEETGFEKQVIQPEVERQQINVSQIDSEDFEIGVFTGVLSVEDFGANAIYGIRGAYHITEGVFFEAAYGVTDTEKTSFERLSGSAQLLTDAERQYLYYNLSVGYNLLPGETFIGERYAFNSALYVIGGLGSTEFAGDNRFTMSFGAGYRLLTTDWLALHADIRDHLMDNDVTGINKTTHNIEISGGVTVFF
ncbi:MAG: outer membrane beta-barrel domain-containing protein [Gammaproteobacteria bacterium]